MFSLSEFNRPDWSSCSYDISSIGVSYKNWEDCARCL